MRPAAGLNAAKEHEDFRGKDGQEDRTHFLGLDEPGHRTPSAGAPLRQERCPAQGLSPGLDPCRRNSGDDGGASSDPPARRSGEARRDHRRDRGGAGRQSDRPRRRTSTARISAARSCAAAAISTATGPTCSRAWPTRSNPSSSEDADRNVAVIREAMGRRLANMRAEAEFSRLRLELYRLAYDADISARPALRRRSADAYLHAPTTTGRAPTDLAAETGSRAVFLATDSRRAELRGADLSRLPQDAGRVSATSSRSRSRC